MLTIHDVSSFANSSDSSIIGNMIYKLTDLILTHNEFSKSEIVKINPNLSSCIYIVPHGNYIPFINVQNDKEKSRKHLEIPNEQKGIVIFWNDKKGKRIRCFIACIKGCYKGKS